MLLKEGEVRIPSGCAIAGFISKQGNRYDGQGIVDSIAIMHDRSNGLGGGFAAYGIYPEYKDYYAFHVFYDDKAARLATEDFFSEHFYCAASDRINTRFNKNITDAPGIMRYFLMPITGRLEESGLDEKEFVSKCVFNINKNFNGAYVFSCGKNMGVFKGVGFPEDIGNFYRLEEYKGYIWTAHGRYPTNTPGWWGGAHPFALLDYSIVHNGEISSYDANRRFIEMYGYNCSLLTDTEAITYIIDFLHRKQKMPLEDVASVIAAPFWSSIERMPEDQKKKITYLRNVYSSLLITGPFSIILGFDGGIMALNDRLKLRSMVAAEKGDCVYVASEESAIRLLCKDPDRVWSPRGGEPIIVTMDNKDNKEA